ncbi:hypothetical protein [Haloferula sp. BvORR071]|uniref:hypothetical protein n=1 Tax=Haloferula sp. BvORR071 TaxID=1396141 RepID=UPI000551A536|nr:hypothetical protein [Haloferula sp. BvORR071]
MKKPVLISTHLLALGAGWLAFQAAGSAQDGGSSSSGGEHASRSERRDGQAEGRRLLSEMRKSWRAEEAAIDKSRTFAPEPPSPSSPEAIQQEREQQQAHEKKVFDLAASLSLPADPAAELKKLMENGLVDDASALVIAWLRRDPTAAMRALNGEELFRHDSCTDEGVRLWSREATAQALLGLMEAAAEWRPLLTELALQKVVATDFSALGATIESLEGLMDRSALLSTAFENLPADRRAAALDWIFANLKGQEAARVVQTAAFDMQTSQSDPLGAKAFLKDAIDRLDAEGKERMSGWANAKDILSFGVGPDSPIDERIDLALMAEARGQTPEEQRANARASIVSNDLRNWFDAGQWDLALQARSVSPAELWAEAKEAFPQFDQTTDQDNMLRLIFMRSALSDPQAAIALLRAEGKQDQLGKYASFAVGEGWSNQLEGTLALVNTLPGEVFRENLSSFDRSYSYLVEREVTARGSFWLDWVKQQPPGLSRDLLYHYTARGLYQQGREAEAEAFRAAVQDPKVKAYPKL